MANSTLGLDIGTSSIKVVRLDGKEAKPSLFDKVEIERSDDVDQREAVNQALLTLHERGSLEADTIVVSVSGDIASLRVIEFPFSDERKIEQTISFELEDIVPFDLDDLVFSWSILRANIDESGKSSVLVGFCRRDAIEELLEQLNDVGVDPRHIVFEPIGFEGLYAELFDDEERDEPETPTTATAIVDIGAAMTNVCVVSGGELLTAQSLLHGGDDATRGLARAFGLAVSDAEAGKCKEAFIEGPGVVAQYPEEKTSSDVLKKSLMPIVRRLRQTFQTVVRDQGIKVDRLILLGGASRTQGIERFLSEQLSIYVERSSRMSSAISFGVVPTSLSTANIEGDLEEAATAFSLALAGSGRQKGQPRLDFRVGDFAWHGDYEFIQERAVAFGAWAGVFFFLAMLSVGTQLYLLGQQEEALEEAQLSSCEKILGQPITSATRCLALLAEKSGAGAFQVPDESAVDRYIEISRRIPPKSMLQRKVTELDIKEERITLKAETTDFDGVDKIVTSLKSGHCFHNVNKGKARNIKDKVSFQVTIDIDCEAAPGGPLPDYPKASGDDQPTTTTRQPPSRAEPPSRKRGAEREKDDSDEVVEEETVDPMTAAARKRARQFKERQEKAERRRPRAETDRDIDGPRRRDKRATDLQRDRVRSKKQRPSGADVFGKGLKRSPLEMRPGTGPMHRGMRRDPRMDATIPSGGE